MKFRTTLLLGTLLLIVVMVLATVVAVATIIDRAARRAMTADLQRSLDVFAELQTYRRTLLRSKAQVLADEPRIKAVLATMDISAATVQGVTRDVGRAIEVDLFVLTDADGAILAELTDLAGSSAGAEIEPGNRDLSGNLLVAAAMRHGQSGGAWTEHDRVYQVQAVRIGFGDELIGVAIVGYLIDDHVARSVHELTASAVAIQHKDRVVAAWPRRAGGHTGRHAGGNAGGNDEDRAALADALAELPVRTRAPVPIELSGARHLAMTAPFPGQDGTGLRYAVMQSLDRALAPGRRLQRVLFTAAALTLTAALFIAMVLARRLTRPIDRLVAFTEKIAAGDLEARAQVSHAGAVELGALADAMNHMVTRIDESRQRLAATERIAQELDIATRIQTSILPRQLAVPDLDVAALMLPAEEVGGDYYDVLIRDHTWIAIGDVAGHGVPAGLVMMMVQNVLSAIIQACPRAAPSVICAEANRVLVDNVRTRLQRDEHVTLTLLRHDGHGRFVFAGAHEDIVVWRARARACETIATPGTWLAVMPDIDRFLADRSLELEPGDTMVLYTDGVTEARDAAGEQFGMQRLCAAIDDMAGAPATELCQHIVHAVESWSSVRQDDVTVVVVRRP